MNKKIEAMLKLTEGVNKFSNEGLLLLKQAIDFEIEERGLKIESKDFVVKHYQLYNPEICKKNNCKSFYHKSCFGIPEKCKINKREGYPKEISEREWIKEIPQDNVKKVAIGVI